MSTPIFPGDVLLAQFVVHAVPSQQVSISNRYYKVGIVIVPGVVTFGDVATDLDTFMAGVWKALLYNSAFYHGCRVRRMLPANTDAWETSTAGGGAGTAGAVALPTQTAGLVRLKTAHLGKHGEGRIYVPFPAAADNITDGVPRVGYISAAVALGGRMSTQRIIVGGTGGQIAVTPIITSPPAFTTQYDVTDSGAADAWATQKRRGSFGRFNVPPF